MTDAVTADKTARRLAIGVAAQHHEVLATFEDARDFGLAACVLKASGFVVREARPRARPPYSPPPLDRPRLDLGPRLSSVTPILGLGPPDHGSEAFGWWAPSPLLSSTSLPPPPPSALARAAS